MQNPFIWHDLMTPDVEGAKAFYKAAIGWDFGPEGPDYHVATASGKGIGGIMATPEHLRGVPPFWSGYIYVADTDAACGRALELGGKICRPAWDIGNIARMAVIADPTGAALNIMTPRRNGPADFPSHGAPGTVAWNELITTDPERAWEFYSNLFSWTRGRSHDIGRPAGVYQHFQINGRDAGGIMRAVDPVPESVWSYYFAVTGVDSAVSRIRQAGGQIISGPHQVPGGAWIVRAEDPYGAHFSAVSQTKWEAR